MGALSYYKEGKPEWSGGRKKRGYLIGPYSEKGRNSVLGVTEAGYVS